MKPELHIEPEIIIRKAKAHGHAHHGGAWKIAYADFVTAMMAFFMLMWILGATNEDQRRGIADYFTPTLIQLKNSGGSNGIMGGRSLQAEEGAAPFNTMHGPRPTAVTGGSGSAAPINAAQPSPRDMSAKRREADEERFRKVERIIAARLAGDPTLKGLKGQIRFVRVNEGLRIDMVERADFSMFGLGNAGMTEAARAMLATVAHAIAGTPHRLTIRGHTDGLGYSRGGSNNWLLSSLRADATRRALVQGGITPQRFKRIEGAADTDPFNPADPADPRNRRISVTLLTAQA
ncbi:flagellar motor protein MotB [alpha proteobacterium AAP81b]|nr:flagellar motor protein MotB [alpha proteobacterium AAP81b]